MHSLIRMVQRADALLALVFGLGFAVAPGRALALYGVAPDQAGRFLAQLLGAAVLGYAWINWLSGTTASDDLRRAVVVSELAFDAPALVVCVIAVRSGVLNALGWSVAGLFAVLLAVRVAVLLVPASGPRGRG